MRDVRGGGEGGRGGGCGGKGDRRDGRGVMGERSRVRDSGEWVMMGKG